MQPTKIEYLNRFMRNIDKDDISGCWNWVGSLNAYGYGQFHVGSKKSKKNYRAHRLSWEIFRGEIKDGLFVLHKCDNRACVNPEHLFLGTQADNVLDCKNKSRAKGGSLKGETNPRSKLTKSDIATIRNKYKQGNVYQYQLAKEFGVSQAHISSIVLEKSWGHV